jgi:hypothetical protein
VLLLNVHAHALAVDGVFTEAADGTLRFYPAPPTDVEVARLVATIRTRVLRLQRRRGMFTDAADDDAPDPLAETSPSPASRVRRSRPQCPEAARLAPTVSTSNKLIGVATATAV